MRNSEESFLSLPRARLWNLYACMERARPDRGQYLWYCTDSWACGMHLSLCPSVPLSLCPLLCLLVVWTAGRLQCNDPTPTGRARAAGGHPRLSFGPRVYVAFVPFPFPFRFVSFGAACVGSGSARGCVCVLLRASRTKGPKGLGTNEPVAAAPVWCVDSDWVSIFRHFGISTDNHAHSPFATHGGVRKPAEKRRVRRYTILLIITIITLLLIPSTSSLLAPIYHLSCSMQHR
jgi:hypothetical protein